MDELDTLFNLDSSLDTLDKTIHEKFVSVCYLMLLQLTALQEASRQHTSTRTRGPAEKATRSRGAIEPGDWQLATQAKGYSRRHQQGDCPSSQSAVGEAPAGNGHPGYAMRNTYAQAAC